MLRASRDYEISQHRAFGLIGAILWNCLGEFAPLLQQRLLTQYGVTDFDRRKLQFHLLLDELF